MIKKVTIFSILLFCCLFRIEGQQNNYAEILNYLLVKDFNSAEILINKKKKSLDYSLLSSISQVMLNRGQKPEEDSKLNLTASETFKEHQIILNHYLNGYYYLNNFPGSIKSLEHFNKAYEMSKKLANKELIRFSLSSIIELYLNQLTLTTEAYKRYLSEFISLSETDVQKALAQYYKSSFLGKDIFSPMKEFSSVTKTLFKPYQEDKLNINLQVRFLDRFGVYYRAIGKIDSSKYYFQKILNLNTTTYNKVHKFYAYLELAALEALEALEGNDDKIKSLTDKAVKLKNISDSLGSTYDLNKFQSQFIYEKSRDWKKAYFSLKEVFVTEAQLDLRANKLTVAQVETELDTAEKEKQILIEQQKNKQNRNIAFGLGGLLLFGGITFLLIQKNTKRKQLLAEQEKELQTQKLATVLKEQELTSIDAMIEGQEKERQRIANDLHDDLGGLMATVKLHFNALKEKQSPELYDKTNKLLDDAYNKVRSVAHTKNSGVMAKKGLLKAINDMARTISESNTLHIDVIDHGLESRLENSLELTIFRIIQELITNIIKHAEATEATIHMTNHEDSLNIMVEDNGKGFNTKNIHKSSGMGIHSIDKRIENLGGTVTIESELNKGTTIIIDIPS